jgi:hypothetical protein
MAVFLHIFLPRRTLPQPNFLDADERGLTLIFFCALRVCVQRILLTAQLHPAA